MDRIFRASHLMRRKWDERHSSDGKTYGELAIQKAIDSCGDQVGGQTANSDRMDETDLKRELEQIAGLGPDSIDLVSQLKPIKQRLARKTQDISEAFLEYMQKDLKIPKNIVQAMRNEIKKIRNSNEGENRNQENQKISAHFPGLVDLVLSEGKPVYLYKEGDDLQLIDSNVDDSGIQLVPPDIESIPYDLLPAQQILNYIDDDTDELYFAILGALKGVSILPSEAHYHLCTIFVFFTHISELADYFPYLWFYGLPERGKSRIVKALANLSYRGFYTETLNEAYIFRLADRFRITLVVDVFELSERAQKAGSHDLLLGRYEKGMKIARVNPDKPAFSDLSYYTVSGPTVFATNKEIPGRDPLLSRCIKIVMPEARAKYPNNSSGSHIDDLRARLLAFRTRKMGKAPPVIEKPVPGRLGDIIHPLLCTARFLPEEATSQLLKFVKSCEHERRESESETLGGKIAQALFDLQDEVTDGMLPVELVRGKVNEGRKEKHEYGTPIIGRELSAMGINRKQWGRGRTMHIIWDQGTMNSLFQRFIPSRENLSNLSNLSYPTKTDSYGGEDQKTNLSCLSPDDRGEREEGEDVKPNLSYLTDCNHEKREDGEKREESPGTPPANVFQEEPGYDTVTI